MDDTLEQQLNKSFLFLERLQPSTQIEIKQKLDIAQKQILTLISKTDNMAKINKELQKIFNEAFSTFETVLATDIEDVSTLAYNATQNIMTQWTSIAAIKLVDANKSIQNRLTSPNNLVQGHKMSNHLRHLSTTNQRKVQGIIAQGFKDGVGIQQINRDIRNSIGNLQRNQLDSLTRTTLLESIRDSQNEVFNYFDKEIIEWYYNSTMDVSTTPRCWSLNLTSSKNKEDITKLLNFHYSCRSILGVRTSLSDEFDKNREQNVVQKDGRIVSHRDGTKSTVFKVSGVKKVSAKASPETAFRAFDEKYQRAYMGRTRFELWRSGKASFSDMTRATRSTFIPLKELKKKLDLD